MARISIDSGKTFFGPDELNEFFIAAKENNLPWVTIVKSMDFETKKNVICSLSPDYTEQDFLRTYLTAADNDLILDYQKKLVIYNSAICLAVTPEDNYHNRIMDVSRVQYCKEFETPEEIIDFYCKYCGKTETDFVVIMD